jgi:hypothetical protein
VDYRQFYDALSEKGEWIQVDEKELGFSGGKPADLENRASFLNKVFGINDAYAQDVSAMFVWRPSPGLAVAVGTNTNTEPVYVPYSNGQWVNTDAGWYFRAPTPAEEITSHYGRWAYSDNKGWVWVPGRVWAPAWVDWRVNDDYIAWAPVPPHVYIEDDALDVPVIDDSRYIIVEKKYFVEPDVYRYYYPANREVVVITDMPRPPGIVVVNRTVINRGPDVTVIENVTGRPITRIELKRVNDMSSVVYKTGSYFVYAPEMKRVHVEKNNGPVSRPYKFNKWDDIKAAGKEERKEQKFDDKELKRNEKDFRKNEKDFRKNDKNWKLGDDREMKKGRDNNNYNKPNKDNNQNRDNNNNKDRGKNKRNDGIKNDNKNDNGNKQDKHSSNNDNHGKKDNGNHGHGKK